CLHYNTKPFTF
nr:immunoglobulin light chain junction region [Macaca mulatta]